MARGNAKWTGIAVIAMFGFHSGCGRTEEVRLAPATGIVRIDGKPAANILVQFLPQVASDAPALISTGVSGADGKFELRTHDGRSGAVIGPCRVLLADMDEERPPDGEPAYDAQREDTPYFVLNGSKIDVEVQPENALFEFDVRW